MAGPPILVTGSHRSGTTWVGTLLAKSGEALSIHEPFNPAYSRSWFADPPNHWFEYVDGESSGHWIDQMSNIIELRPPISALLRRNQTPRHLVGVTREFVAASRAHRRGCRALLKDPIAFFSAPWIADEFDAQVVVLVRHPAAFASSLKRLDWDFDFSNFVSQSRLLSGPLCSFRDEILEAAASSVDIIDVAILLWRIFGSIAIQYRAEHPTWNVIRYEDLAGDPTAGFRSLYRALDLEWSSVVEAEVRRYTSGAEARPVHLHDKGGVRRDSGAAIWSWADRLTPEEIERVRYGTADVASIFYQESDWRPG